MSYVTVYKVEPNGNVVYYGDAQNNHGFAPLVWQELGIKHKIFPPDVDLLWGKFGTSELTREENILLGATFDRVWIARDLIPDLIIILRNFYHECLAPKEYVDTILQIATSLEEILTTDARGAAFNCCSAVESFWTVQQEEEMDTGEIEYFTDPYNVDKTEPQHQGTQATQKAWELKERLISKGLL